MNKEIKDLSYKIGQEFIKYITNDETINVLHESVDQLLIEYGLDLIFNLKHGGDKVYIIPGRRIDDLCFNKLLEYIDNDIKQSIELKSIY